MKKGDRRNDRAAGGGPDAAGRRGWGVPRAELEEVGRGAFCFLTANGGSGRQGSQAS